MESKDGLKRITLTEAKLAEIEKIKKKDKILAIISKILLAMQLILLILQFHLGNWIVFVILGLAFVVLVLCGIKINLSNKIADIIVAGAKTEE